MINRDDRTRGLRRCSDSALPGWRAGCRRLPRHPRVSAPQRRPAGGGERRYRRVLPDDRGGVGPHARHLPGDAARRRSDVRYRRGGVAGLPGIRTHCHRSWGARAAPAHAALLPLRAGRPAGILRGGGGAPGRAHSALQPAPLHHPARTRDSAPPDRIRAQHPRH